MAILRKLQSCNHRCGKARSAEEPETAFLLAGDAFGADIVVALRRVGEGETLGDEQAGEIDAVAIETDRRTVGPRLAREAARDGRLASKPGGEDTLSLLEAGQRAPRLRAAAKGRRAAADAAIAAGRRADAEEIERGAVDAQSGGAGGLAGAGDLRSGGPRSRGAARRRGWRR